MNEFVCINQKVKIGVTGDMHRLHLPAGHVIYQGITGKSNNNQFSVLFILSSWPQQYIYKKYFTIAE